MCVCASVRERERATLRVGGSSAFVCECMRVHEIVGCLCSHLVKKPVHAGARSAMLCLGVSGERVREGEPGLSFEGRSGKGLQW